MEPADFTEDLERIRRRDPEAIRDLVHVWDQRLYRIAYRILGSEADAEEARQAVFARIIERPDRLPPADRFAAWIQRCVINEAISIGRRTTRGKRILKQVASRPAADVAAPDQVTADIEERERLQAELNTLPEETRAILSLRYDEGLSIRQIADLLERPHTSIHSLLQRTIQQLRIRLSHSPEHDDVSVLKRH